MKVYISVDMEGVSGISHWNETEKGNPDYDYFAEQMSVEASAACRGALLAGAEEIIVKDAHGSGRNIDHTLLPETVSLISGWRGSPECMVEGIDTSFDVAIFIGYHCGAGTGGNPLAHTLSPDVHYIKINGELADEMVIHMYACRYIGIPVAFVSGDAIVCKHASQLCNEIEVCAVSNGNGNSSLSISPFLAVKSIEEGVEEALKKDISLYSIEIPNQFTVEVSYKEFQKAEKASYYPGVKRVNPHTVEFQSEDYYEILRMMLFTV